VIDLHSHILPRLDDGARTLDDSIAIARAAVEDGVRVIAATPHVRDDYPTSVTEMQRALAQVRAALAQDGIELDVRPGGELAYGELMRLSATELRGFALAGNPRYLLIETPYSVWPLGLADTVARLHAQGITAVIAHPERNRDVQNDFEHVAALVRRGALVQVTAASVDGRLGQSARGCAERLLERRLVHLLASDAHNANVREAGLSRACNTLDDPALAQWLTLDVPGAIVDDAPLPPQPAPARPSRRRRGIVSRLLGG
jgi:protein-tyrosine phosphatase